MKRLPLITLILLVVGILAWNVPFYGDYYRSQSARPVRSELEEAHLKPVAPQAVGDGRPVELRQPRLEVAPSGGEPGGESSQDASADPGPPVTDSAPGEVERLEYLYPSGALKSRGSLVEGRREGPWTEFWENGEVLMSGRYRDGKREGEWSFYYDDGSLRSRGRYVGGLRDGLWRGYYPGGAALRSEGRHSAEQGGERVGLWTQYYENGAIRERGSYERGVMQGYWVFYDPEGNEDRRTGNYREGVLDRL